MAAYLSTFIYGNEDFGGYFSVDGETSVAVQNDMTYQIEPGPHHIEFFSTSNVQRKAGAFQAKVYCNTSSSGALFDALERREALKNLGDSWTIDVFVEEDQMLILNVRSKGNSIVGSPSYMVQDLSEEQVETLEEMFDELEEEIIAEMNRPKRKPAKIVWGIILLVIGAYLGIMFMQNPEMMSEGYPAWTPYVAIGALLLVGLLLFINGIRKKVRN